MLRENLRCVTRNTNLKKKKTWIKNKYESKKKIEECSVEYYLGETNRNPSWGELDSLRFYLECSFLGFLFGIVVCFGRMLKEEIEW